MSVCAIYIYFFYMNWPLRKSVRHNLKFSLMNIGGGEDSEKSPTVGIELCANHM